MPVMLAADQLARLTVRRCAAIAAGSGTPRRGAMLFPCTSSPSWYRLFLTSNYLNDKDSRMSREDAGELVRLVQEQIAVVLSFTAAMARRMGLGLSEIAALEHLQGAGGLTPGQLGARLSMTSGAVTALVDRLERGGYVQRSPHPRDRRSSIIRMTDTGAQEATRHLHPLAAEILQIAAARSNQDRETIAAFLRDITATVTHQASNASADGPADGPKPPGR